MMLSHLPAIATPIFLLSIRIGTALLFLPLQLLQKLPFLARLSLVFLLSYFLVSSLSLNLKTLNEMEFFFLALIEACNGLILSLSLYASFAVFQIAGHIIDTQIGLNAMSVFNPQEHSLESAISRLLNMLGVLSFFAVQGPHWLLRSFAYSLEIIPLGKLSFALPFAAMLKALSFMFTFSILITSPIVIAMLLIDFSSAILSRHMPQISIYFLILPFKIICGILLLITTLNHLNPLLERVFNSFYQVWKGAPI